MHLKNWKSADSLVKTKNSVCCWTQLTWTAGHHNWQTSCMFSCMQTCKDQSDCNWSESLKCPVVSEGAHSVCTFLVHSRVLNSFIVNLSLHCCLNDNFESCSGFISWLCISESKTPWTLQTKTPLNSADHLVWLQSFPHSLHPLWRCLSHSTKCSRELPATVASAGASSGLGKAISEFVLPEQPQEVGHLSDESTTTV